MHQLVLQFRNLIAVTVVALVLGVIGSPKLALAHAELESSSPPAKGTVTSLPSSLTLVFSEEVKPGSVSVTVTGEDGQRVDDGGAAVDLNDPERTRVNVTLFAGGDGIYTVQWQTISNIDGDQAEGSYTFTVAADPVAAGSPVTGTPGNIGSPPAAAIAPTEADLVNGNPLGTTEDFDSRAFAISIGAGLLALVAIVGFWFLLRPRNPKYGGRARPGKG
jgi:methionine-rich copper-binding protein CopC